MLFDEYILYTYWKFIYRLPVNTWKAKYTIYFTFKLVYPFMTIYHYTGTWQTMTKSVVLYTKDKVKTSIPYKSSHLNGSLKRTHWKKNLLDVDETFEICAMKNILRAVSLQGFNEEIRYQNSRKGPTFVFVTVITFDQ